MRFNSLSISICRVWRCCSYLVVPSGLWVGLYRKPTSFFKYDDAFLYDARLRPYSGDSTARMFLAMRLIPIRLPPICRRSKSSACFSFKVSTVCFSFISSDPLLYLPTVQKSVIVVPTMQKICIHSPCTAHKTHKQ